MLRILSIEISQFRGIRYLKLDFGGQNVGICGPNGSGKSGVVDAIEFWDVTRLSGQGTGELSLKLHGPHVDESPQNASVKIHATLDALDKKVTIERSVANPKAPKIAPSHADVRNIVSSIQVHPEFALSRREIAKFIITPAGNRARDVQTLLRLDEVEAVRKSLVRVTNECSKDVSAANEERSAARAALATALGIEALQPDAVLKAVNLRRKTLGLNPITSFSQDTSLKEGIIAREQQRTAGPE
jgi:DNA repair exonuclease SbcCD ATPase subunit